MTQRLERVQTTGFRITPKSTEPISPTENDIYLDDGTNTASGEVGFRRYTGAAWEDIGGGIGGAGASDAEYITFTPASTSDWDDSLDPGNVDNALDQLAFRAKYLELNGTGGGGSGSAATDPVFHIGGVLATASEVDGAWIAPRPSTIQYVYIYCRDPGSAGSTIVDVNLNGTSIFDTTQANRPTLAYDDADQVAKSGAPDITALVENDVLSIDIDQVGTGAEDLTVIVALQIVPPDAASLSSGSASDGYVLTADGLGGAAWESPPVVVSDASDITYTPAVAADWDSDADPGSTMDALDQLAERVDDLEGAGGGGDSTYTATYASRPAASNDGDLFLPSDGFVIERDTGAAWVPWGPVFPLVAPPLTGWSWDNQGLANIDTSKGTLCLYCPADTDDNHFIYRTSPSVPYTIVLAALVTAANTNYVSFGFGWTDNDLKYDYLRLLSNGGIWSVTRLKMNSANSMNSYTEYSKWSLGQGPLFVKLEDDNSNRKVSLSSDGVYWTEIMSVGRTNFITPTRVALCVNSRSSFRTNVNVISWKET